MNLKGCGWGKSWHDLTYHIAIYQQGVRKPVNSRVERRCPGRDLKPGAPEYETGMTLTRSKSTCYVYLITLLGFLPVRVLYYVPHTLESRTRKYCVCCVRMCESILKAWHQRPIEQKVLLPHTDNTLYLYSKPYMCGTICGEVCAYCMAKN
jgi:hypothetical protein